MASLVPAEDLAAIYDPKHNELKLYARGEIDYVMLGVKFVRDRWTGGLKFSLKAYHRGMGTAGPPMLKKYDADQAFIFPDLRQLLPSNEVIIVTSNHPNGVLVPVDWLGAGAVIEDPFFGPATKPLEAPLTDGAPRITMADEPTTIDTTVGGRFTVSAAVPSEFKDTSMDVDYSEYVFSLKNCSMYDGILRWEFRALKPGKYGLVIDVHIWSDKPDFKRIVYIVNVQEHRMSSTTLEQASAANSGGYNYNSTFPPGEVITFLGRINEALDIVRQTKPDAETLSARGEVPWGIWPPVKDPVELSDLVCEYKTDEGTSLISTEGFDKWGPPEHRKGPPPLGIQPFPLEGISDVISADEAIRKIGVHPLYNNVELYQGVGASATTSGTTTTTTTADKSVTGNSPPQPYYHFKCYDGKEIRVGARDLNVVLPSSPTAQINGVAVANGSKSNSESLLSKGGKT